MSKEDCLSVSNWCFYDALSKGGILSSLLAYYTAVNSGLDLSKTHDLIQAGSIFLVVGFFSLFILTTILYGINVKITGRNEC